MTMTEFLNSPAAIALAALFIGMGANALAFWKIKQDSQEQDRHKENLHIAIARLDKLERSKFDILQSIDK